MSLHRITTVTITVRNQGLRGNLALVRPRQLGPERIVGVGVGLG